MRVLGIDPGLAATGYGLIDGRSGAGEAVRLLDYGVIRTDAAEVLPLRLSRLHEAIAGLIRGHRPDTVAVEELFFARNASTALLVGHARGVVLLAAGQAAVPVREYKPREVKLALTGYGAADKKQVQEMLRLTLGLEVAPHPDDAADAVAVAICHLQSARLADLR